MHRLMAISNKLSLTCSQQRALFRYVRNYPEALAGLEEEVASEAIVIKDDLIDRITVKDANKNYTFTIEGTRYHYRGFESTIPDNAEDVVCTDDWTRRDGSAIPTWA